MNTIEKIFRRSVEVKKSIIERGILSDLESMGKDMAHAIENGNKLMFCGNGGSAADAQHLAAEFLVRLRSHFDRIPLPALSLAQDTSTITACGNDYGYHELFARVLRALGKKGDILVAISTSGTSTNINKALQAAKEIGAHAFAFLGSDGGEALSLCEKAFVVPDKDTGRIQEAHITAGHAVLQYVEETLTAKRYL